MQQRFSPAGLARHVGVHVATVWRWLEHGVKGRRLASRLVGGRRYIMQADLDAFLADQVDGSPLETASELSETALEEAELDQLLKEGDSNH